jgi:hypothetical protein
MTNFRQKKSLGAERGEEGVAAERLRFSGTPEVIRN